MAELLAPQSLETLDNWGSIDALDAFGSLEALDNIELFETSASVSIAFGQSVVAGEVFSTSGSASISLNATGVANKLFDTDNALNTSFTVKVVSSGGNKYEVNGVVAPALTMLRGVTYTFDVSDSSNNNHPLRFKDSGGSSYTSGVTANGTEGQANSTVVFAVPSDAPSSLRYYCTVHGEAMGNTISVTDDVAAAALRVNVGDTTYVRFRTVSATPTISITGTGDEVNNQIGAAASVTISLAKSATIEAIEHVSSSVSISIPYSTPILQRVMHTSADGEIAITGTGLLNFTTLVVSNESVSFTTQAEAAITSVFNSNINLSVSSEITGEILGERWIPVTTSSNNVWHLR